MEFLLSKLSLIGPFFLLLGVLIFIHEWGHFIVARMCGVRVETFSLGFGPKIFSYKWGDTNYCLSLIPLGGYVKMFGDGTETEELSLTEQKYSFNHQNIFEKIAIVAAGPLMNLLFAFLLFILMGITGAPEASTKLGDVEKGSVAFNSGLRNGDIIKSVNGVAVKYYEDFANKISLLQTGSKAELDVLRSNGDISSLSVPIKIVENTSPLATSKKLGVIEGLNLKKASARVGVDYRSSLFSQGAEAIEKISQVNSNPVESFFELNKAIEQADPNKDLLLSIQKNKGESIQLAVKKQDGSPWTFKKAGLVKPELMIGQVQKGSPAMKSGLLKGDQILSINGITLNDWMVLVETIKTTKKDESATLSVANKDGVREVIVTPNQTELLTADGKVEYRPTIGLAPGLEYLPPHTITKKIAGVGSLMSYGAERSNFWIKVTLSGFKKLITGEVSHKTLSGVISIGKVARDSLDVGWSYFIKMMAIISINLFLLNLFPIPVLDGGHLLFYFTELIKGSPVSLKTRLIGQQIGVVLVLSLVVYTIFNDVSRIIFSGW